MDTVSNCEPWTVRRLASHALNNQLLWAGIVTGTRPCRPRTRWARSPYDGDLAQYADDVADRALAMWATDGVLDAIHVTPMGELPGSVVINFAIIDAFCHAWDLAASVGHPIEFAAEMIPTISLVVAATCTDAAREHGLIKPVAPTPAGRHRDRTAHGCRGPVHFPLTSAVRYRRVRQAEEWRASTR